MTAEAVSGLTEASHKKGKDHGKEHGNDHDKLKARSSSERMQGKAIMQLGRVVGTMISTLKHPTFQGERMLIVQLETANGGPDGEPVLAFDRLGAGRGDRVLLTNDGRELQEKLGNNTPGRWSVMGLPDG